MRRVAFVRADILPMPVRAMAGIAAVRAVEPAGERRTRLLGAIAQLRGVSVRDMLSMSQAPAVVAARREAMAEMRFRLDMTTGEIAELFNRRRETVHYNLRLWLDGPRGRAC